MKLLLTLHHRFELWNAPPWLAERLRADFPQLTVVQLPTYEGVDREIADADIFLGWSLRPEQVLAAKRLRWIHSPAAAVHQLMTPELVASQVVVTNAREVHGPVVAEHVIAVLLALAKRLPSALRYQQQGVWAQERLWDETPRPREVAGATLGLVGYGSIGRQVARRALALDLRVLALREHPEKENLSEGRGFSRAGTEATKGSALAAEVKGPSALNRVLSEADFLVLAAPLTPATRHLINAERLALMKPDAYLINVARGPLIDDAALIAALRSRRLAGAALDVFPREPLPADSPYWELDNVLITPHTAAVTEKLWDRHYALIADNLRRFLSRQPLRNVVDKALGY